MELTGENWKDFASAHRHTSVSEKLRKLLLAIAERTRYPGYGPDFHPQLEYPLIDALSEHECAYFLQHARELGYIKYKGTESVQLTLKGWKEIEPTGSGGTPGRCFVAMSCDASLKDAYDSGIHAAIKVDCEMEPVLIERVHHNEKICDRLLAEIRRCQFVVADVTLERQNVYFEAGFALGLGRSVIWTCRKGELMHFDTRQYSHIVWNEPADLRRQLADRVQATIVK